MANEQIMKGRVVGFSSTPHSGTFPGSLTYVTICAAELPAVGQKRPEVEITNSCSSAEEFIGGFASGQDWTATGYFRGANATDFGSGVGALLALAKAGTIIGVKDNSAQFSNPIVYRFDVTLLDWEFGGGSVKDAQKWMVRGRITGDVNVATS